MRKRTVLLGLGAVVLVALVATPIILMPGPVTGSTALPAAIDAAEQAATIEAMRPPKRERPVIAIMARNDGTEVSDFLSAYGVLKRADVADVMVVAERAETIDLYPVLSAEPDITIAGFEERYPEGADYVVVPAMDPGTDPVIAAWLADQYARGAKIVSICNGSRMIGTAGLLNDRRATGHWSAVAELRGKYPTMQYVPDRRYVSDNGVTSSTGITANIPVMLALVEAIGGRPAAERVAGELGVDNWDARHHSADFELNTERKKTFVRNTLSLWNHETVGIPIADGVDEVALGFLVDAYSRTALTKVATIGEPSIKTLNGLTLHADQLAAGAGVDRMLPAPLTEAPATTLERELPLIVDRYGRHTADIVALTMEYPWVAAAEAR